MAKAKKNLGNPAQWNNFKTLCPFIAEKSLLFTGWRKTPFCSKTWALHALHLQLDYILEIEPLDAIISERLDVIIERDIKFF